MCKDVYRYIQKMELREKKIDNIMFIDASVIMIHLKNMKHNQPLFYLLLKDVHNLLSRKIPHTVCFFNRHVYSLKII